MRIGSPFSVRFIGPLLISLSAFGGVPAWALRPMLNRAGMEESLQPPTDRTPAYPLEQRNLPDLVTIEDLTKPSRGAKRWGRDDFEQERRKPGTQGLCLFDGLKTIGFLIWRRREDSTALLLRMGVHPNYRGQGIGRRLMKPAPRGRRRLSLRHRKRSKSRSLGNGERLIPMPGMPLSAMNRYRRGRSRSESILSG